MVRPLLRPDRGVAAEVAASTEATTEPTIRLSFLEDELLLSWT